MDRSLIERPGHLSRMIAAPCVRNSFVRSGARYTDETPSRIPASPLRSLAVGLSARLHERLRPHRSRHLLLKSRSLTVPRFDPRNIICRNKPVLRVAASGADVERWLHCSKRIPSAHVDEVPGASAIALTRNENDVAGLTLGALLRVFHPRFSFRPHLKTFSCHGRAGVLLE
jgi:hypothetical protein